jgi:hypothetical protein
VCRGGSTSVGLVGIEPTNDLILELRGGTHLVIRPDSGTDRLDVLGTAFGHDRDPRADASVVTGARRMPRLLAVCAFEDARSLT